MIINNTDKYLSLFRWGSRSHEPVAMAYSCFMVPYIEMPVQVHIQYFPFAPIGLQCDCADLARKIAQLSKAVRMCALRHADLCLTVRDTTCLPQVKYAIIR